MIYPMPNFKSMVMKSLTVLLVVILLVACSGQESESDSDRSGDVSAPSGNDVTDKETNMQQDLSELSDDELREMFVDSFVIAANVPRSRVVASEVELSQTEREVLETLGEFNAVEAESGTTLTLPDHILFDFDSDVLQDEADEVIEQLVQVIEAADGDVNIVGHTDNVGDPAYNQDLSERRAQAVKDALVAKGIAKSRLHAEGMGETAPVARNTYPDGSDDEDGRRKNRRVEVTVQGLRD